MNGIRSQTILVLTPTLTGGSWVVIEDLINKIPLSTKIVIVGLGPGRAYSNTKLIRIPFFLFDNLKSVYGASIFFNLIYQIPLLLVSIIAYIIYRPQKVLSNGFTPILLTMFVSRIMGSRNIIYYGSVVENKIENPIIKYLLKKLDSFVDNVFVNSSGSFTDLSLIINPQKITTIEHWTDISPIIGAKRIQLRKKMKIQNKYIILYIGKLAPDKSCDFFIDIARQFKNDKYFEFWFAGAGSLRLRIENLSGKYSNIRYLGFISKRKDITKYFSAADLTLTFADETYLARPAIESVSCGTPIMVSDRPAIIEKANKVKIPQTLIPADIGWLADSTDVSKSVALIKHIASNKISLKMRNQCLKYSAEKYSSRNIIPALKILNKTIRKY